MQIKAGKQFTYVMKTKCGSLLKIVNIKFLVNCEEFHVKGPNGPIPRQSPTRAHAGEKARPE